MALSSTLPPITAPQTEFVLGIPFVSGTDAASAAAYSLQTGGLTVAPSGPNLADAPSDPRYVEAVSSSDCAVADSALMVGLWHLLNPSTRIQRVSGLALLREAIKHPILTRGPSLWVCPNAQEASSTRQYLKNAGLNNFATYVAPLYAQDHVQDRALLQRVEDIRPACVVICIGGGIQEKLGFWLREQLSYRPALLCTGAAIAFLTGHQASIPALADRFCIGWLLRCLRQPRRFIPRYARAIRLVGVMFRWKSRPPAQ